MKKIVYSFLLSFAGFSLAAQCDVPSGGGGGGASLSTTTVGSSLSLGASNNHHVNQQFFSDAFSGKFTAQQSYANVTGSAFLADESIEGTLIMNDGTQIAGVPLQVDLYKQDFIATTAEGKEMYINKKYYQEIILPHDGNNISFKKINPKKPDQFFEVLYEDGDMVFFKERYVTKKEPMSNGMFKREAEFTNRTKYFMKHSDGKIAKVKLKKKDIFGNFPDAEVYAMLEYAKANGIKLKKEVDFVAVFEGVSK